MYPEAVQVDPRRAAGFGGRRAEQHGVGQGGPPWHPVWTPAVFLRSAIRVQVPPDETGRLLIGQRLGWRDGVPSVGHVRQVWLRLRHRPRNDHGTDGQARGQHGGRRVAVVTFGFRFGVLAVQPRLRDGAARLLLRGGQRAAMIGRYATAAAGLSHPGGLGGLGHRRRRLGEGRSRLGQGGSDGGLLGFGFGWRGLGVAARKGLAAAAAVAAVFLLGYGEAAGQSLSRLLACAWSTFAGGR